MLVLHNKAQASFVFQVSSSVEVNSRSLRQFCIYIDNLGKWWEYSLSKEYHKTTMFFSFYLLLPKNTSQYILYGMNLLT